MNSRKPLKMSKFKIGDGQFENYLFPPTRNFFQFNLKNTWRIKNCVVLKIGKIFYSFLPWNQRRCQIHGVLDWFLGAYKNKKIHTSLILLLHLLHADVNRENFFVFVQRVKWFFSFFKGKFWFILSSSFKKLFEALN